MVHLPALLFSGYLQTIPVSVVATTTLTANVIRDFFMNVFLHPGEHTIAVIICCGVVAAPFVGLAFLIKWIYEKYCPDRTIQNSN
jgi:hypothetical protein